MDRETQKQVRQRAENRCEYCRLHQDHSPLAALQIEHIIPRKHNGDDSRGNLALTCIDCNQAKGSNIAGIDPDTGRMSRLFHPRRDRWNDILNSEVFFSSAKRRSAEQRSQCCV
jgi:5-methylcytosine-specific restriction endonuclease McrA